MGDTQINSSADDQPHDLAWLAFRYVSAELTAEEAAAFEGRLADDQTAREAVAQAVELSAAVKLAIGEGVACPEPAFALVEARGFWSQRAWLQPAAWMAVGAAACLAAVLCFYQPIGNENQPAIARKNSGEGDSLAMVWAESRQPGSDSIEFDLLALPDGVATDSGPVADSNDEHGNSDDDLQVIAPGWLLAAVTRGELTDDLQLFPDDE